MKKSLIKIVIALILFSLLIAWLQNWLMSPAYVWEWSWDAKHTDNIIKEKEVSLNWWLELYNQWAYKKVNIEDWVKMKWYVFSGSTQQSNLLSFGQSIIVDNYYLVTTKKPLDTSITDLGLSLTWDTKINTIYNEDSVRQEILKEFWVMILILLAFLIVFRITAWKWNWAGWLMNIKVWKKSTKETSKTRFSDIAGMEEVKNELVEVVDYLKHPEKYQKVWARPPKWVLLYWEPGSWKTLLARAVAWEANVAFFSASGSEFMEMLVGMWAAKVRTLFQEAKSAWRAIIFIDEIDAIWKKRWNGTTWWHQEQEQTLNQILTEMDWFDNQTNIIVMAATNRPDTLDPALLRAGRFDRKIYVTAPTAEERTEIFKYYLKNKQVSSKVNLLSLTKRTSGLVWADIENIVNEAALKIAKEDRTILEPSDFEYALEKVLMGPEKKSKWIQENEKKITAFHELWHALLAHIQPEADPVEKISIVRRGQALWVTWTTPTEDKNLYSKHYILSEISVMLAGRAAEEVFFGKDEITTGASNDFERANKMVRNMLTKFWMDEDLGLVVYPEVDQSDFSFFKPYSETTALKIDEKVKSYLERAYAISKQTILDHKDVMQEIADMLIKKEYLLWEDFAQMIDHPEKIEQYKKADDLLSTLENEEDKNGNKSKKENKNSGKGSNKKTTDKRTIKEPSSISE